MKKRSIAIVSGLLAAALMAAGCGLGPAGGPGRRTPGVPSGAPPAPGVGPGQTVEAPGSATPSPVEPAPEPDSLPVPPAPRLEVDVLPAWLQVSPDRSAYALWHVLQGDGLLAWRAGDDRSVRLSGLALREIAWAPDGLYFARLTSPMEGEPEIARYRWGGRRPEVVVDSARLKGYPRALAWDAEGGRLIYSDDEGLKAATPDGGTVSPLPGPGVPGTVIGGAFAPGKGLRYVTVAGGGLVLATAGRTESVPILDVGPRSLFRAAWPPAGDRVAVQLGIPAGEAGQIVVFDVPAEGAPGEVLRVDGTSPVIIADRLYYLAGDGEVLEVRLPGGQPRRIVPPRAFDLAGDPAAARLYLLSPEGPPGRVQYLDVGSLRRGTVRAMRMKLAPGRARGTLCRARGTPDRAPGAAAGRALGVTIGVVMAAAFVWTAFLSENVLSRVDFEAPSGTPLRATVVGRGPWSRFGSLVEVSAAAQGSPPASFRGLAGKRPWKVCAGDFDGDGRTDLLVGVWKDAPFDRNPAPRPFVYDVDAGVDRVTLRPKWLGSALPGPFADLAAGDVDSDGKAELIALMLTPAGRTYLASYGWNGFGFSGESASAPFAGLGVGPSRPGLTGLYVSGGLVVVPGVGSFENREGILIGPEGPGGGKQ